MPLPTKPTRESDDSSIPSNNLWVGNLAPDVTDSDLMELFAKYGALDSVTSYSSRSYAFIFFKRVEDAKAAKNALQGTTLRGSSLKIEFARPAKACKQLWVGGVSPAVSKEELEAEFRKFGKIEDFKFFRDRNTACVEFFNLEDATQAMKIMNGKRIGGEHIRVDFLRSQSTKKDQLDYGQFQGKGLGPTDAYSGQKRPLHSQPPMGRKGDGQPSNILWIGYPPAVQIDEQMLHNAMILFGEIERIKSFPLRNYSIVEFRSIDEARRAKEGLQGRLFNDPRITIMYSSMAPNNFPGQLPPSGIMGPNVPLRPFDGPLPVDDGPFPVRNMDDRGNHLGSVSSRITAGGHGFGQPDIDHIWRGIIAKGGTPVCHARCVPIGKGIGTELPDIVDCSARTGLDILTKHFADAIGFDIVFFLPDSEDDFASYTEFLRYLGAKNRAGVAKFVDNTTLFLVPPSDFLTKVLKVAGPERLYGVIPPSQTEYGMIPMKEEQVLPMDYNRSLHDDSKHPAKPVYPPAGGPPSVQSVPQDYAPNTTNVAGSQAGVALTPELIATLASLLPAQSSGTDGAKSAIVSSTMKPPFPPVAPNDGNQSHLWKQDNQIADQSTHPPQQLRTMYNVHNAHYQPYPPASAPAGNAAQVVSSSSHIQDTAASLQQQGAASSRHMSNFMIPTQSGQQPNNSIAFSNQVTSANPAQQQTAMPYTVDQLNSETPNQQLPNFGVGQGTSEVEADKNQRYQSTLQFAANLLHQIQQQQQQAPGGHGSGIQQ
uniref:Nucleolysin TIAR n=1 Tax=Cajanus cajan TaxID=3821 RepID=A0A151TG12_CAJCA|nr:Nucleolysin TIAR [Cajanus cajan]